MNELQAPTTPPTPAPPPGFRPTPENLRATATLSGSDVYPKVRGLVRFYTDPEGGAIVDARVTGLPRRVGGRPATAFAFHIHENRRCGSGTMPSPFSAAGGHFNPAGKPHPLHVGDLPDLPSCRGRGRLVAYTDRFAPDDVLGLTVVLHEHTDDFTSQPSGNAGDRIACGVITQV